MCNRAFAIVLGLAFSFFSTTTAFLAEKMDLKPGEWEIHVKMEIPGMPFPMPPTTVKQCLTADEPVPNPKSDNQDCTTKEMKISGNTAKWKIECRMEGGQTMQGDGEVTFSGTTMSGTQTISGPGPGGESTIETTYSGKWIGPCKEEKK